MDTILMKFRARQTLKGRWPIALLVGLIAALPSLLAQVGATMSLNDGLLELNDLIYRSHGSAFALMNALTQDTAWMMKLLWIPLGLMAGAALLSAFLQLGKTNYMLGLLSGEEGSVSTVFSRVGSFFKAIGLQVMIGLRCVLYFLPLMAGSVALLVLFGNATGVLARLLTLGIMAGETVLTFWLMLRYAMAMYILAEHPETGVNACIRESVSMMKGRKGSLLMLQVSFIGWQLLRMLIGEAAGAMLGMVVGSTISMTLGMALSIYIDMAVCVFYLENAGAAHPQTEN